MLRICSAQLLESHKRAKLTKYVGFYPVLNSYHAPSIRLSNVSLIYEQKLLFNQLSLNIPGGKWTCLLGPSGVGKTSLLRLIAGLDSEAVVQNPIGTSDGLPLENRIAYLAQNDFLLPWLTNLENALIGFSLRGAHDQARVRKARHLLSQVGLEKVMEAKPAVLSGGMKQRVLLVRTLMEEKPVVLLDEPFAALDAISRINMQDLAFQLLRGRTVLLVTHDPLEALRLGNHLLIMSGRPATIEQVIHLDSPPLRELNNPAVLKWQAEILQHLSHAKEVLEA